MAGEAVEFEVVGGEIGEIDGVVVESGVIGEADGGLVESEVVGEPCDEVVGPRWLARRWGLSWSVVSMAR